MSIVDLFFGPGPIMVWCVLLVMITYFTYQGNEKRKESWEQLAQQKKLNFIPGDWLSSGASLSGVYHGHSLVLDTLQKQRGKSLTTFTRIRVCATQVHRKHIKAEKKNLGEPLTTQEIFDLLTPTNFSSTLEGEFTVQSYGYKLCYQQYGVEDDITYLARLFDFMSDLSDNYLRVLDLGGEAVPSLEKIVELSYPAKSIATQLLRDISRETTQRLGRQTQFHFCPDCLTHFSARNIHLSWWETVTYYGCRVCGQSRQFLSGDHLVAMLDNEVDVDTCRQNGDLHVNWLKHRHMFDFDKVQIVHATDEDVERFAVQMGNDTDPVRRPRYETMQCIISPECWLSENSTRILERMFGEIVTKNYVDA